MKSNIYSQQQFRILVENCMMNMQEYFNTPHDNNLYLFLRAAYVQSAGKSALYINNLISKVRPIKDYNLLENHTGLFSNSSIQNIEYQLKNTSGYATFKKPSIMNECRELNDYLDTLPVPENSNRIILTNWEVLRQFKIVEMIRTDRSIKTIVDRYLNCNSVVNSVVAWKTIQSDNGRLNMSKDAMHFHFDCDHNRFMKVFVYLDSVDNSCGPHIFVPNSSAINRYRLPKSLHRDGRYNSLEIINSGLCPQYILGDVGTIIFADTHNLHRGSPLRAGRSRYVLSIQFVDSVAGATPTHNPVDILEMNN